MSNDELNKYKEIHSEFIIRFVNYYNIHLKFINNVSHDSSTGLKKNLREMVRLGKDMRLAIQASYEEMRKNKKEELAAKRAKRKFHKPQHPPPGKKRKNNNVNNDTTEN